MLRTVGIALLVTIIATPVASQPRLRSSDLAKQLASRLSERRLDAFAVRDPSEPDRFVAALFFADAQLLVISARYASPPVMDTKLAQRQYRDVYLDLQGSSVPNSSWFLQDMDADGLCRERDQAADVLYDGKPAPTIFDGDWKKHGLSAEAYQQQLSLTDDQYSRLLQTLLSQVEGT
jgi:hypothetical protein